MSGTNRDLHYLLSMTWHLSKYKIDKRFHQGHFYLKMLPRWVFICLVFTCIPGDSGLDSTCGCVPCSKYNTEWHILCLLIFLSLGSKPSLLGIEKCQKYIYMLTRHPILLLLAIFCYGFWSKLCWWFLFIFREKFLIKNFDKISFINVEISLTRDWYIPLRCWS